MTLNNARAKTQAPWCIHEEDYVAGSESRVGQRVDDVVPDLALESEWRQVTELVYAVRIGRAMHEMHLVTTPREAIGELV